MARFRVSEIVSVGFDRCEFCGAATNPLEADVGGVALKSAYEEFDRPFGKSACRACIHSGAYLDGRAARPESLARAKVWERSDCECGGRKEPRCMLCLGSGKLYDDGRSIEGGLALPAHPIQDWEHEKHIGVVLHASGERALWCTRRWDFWYPSSEAYCAAQLDLSPQFLWLEEAPGMPLYRVYEARFMRWLSLDEVAADYGSEWRERSQAVSEAQPVLEVSLRVPREILQ